MMGGVGGGVIVWHGMAWRWWGWHCGDGQARDGWDGDAKMNASEQVVVCWWWFLKA